MRKQRPKAAESAMRALIERSIADVDLAKEVHGDQNGRQAGEALQTGRHGATPSPAWHEVTVIASGW